MTKRSELQAMDWKAVTLERVFEWTGEWEVERGKREIEFVRRPMEVPDGGVIATVVGVRESVVRVWLEGGVLRSKCTCGSGEGCHHAVSLILVLMERAHGGGALSMWDEEGEARLEALSRGPEKLPERKVKRVSKKDADGYLLQWSREELETWLLSVVGKHHDVEKKWGDWLTLHGMRDVVLLNRIRGELKAAQKALPYEADGRHHYNRVVPLMGEAYERGLYEEVLDLGLDLKEVAQLFHVNSYKQESYLTKPMRAICDWMEKALVRSQRSETDNVLWRILAYEHDPYGWMEGKFALSSDEVASSLSREEWKMVSKALRKVYARQKEPDKPRDRKTLLTVMRLAGETDECVAMLEGQLVHAEDYRKLIRELLQSGDLEKAEAWCWKALEKWTAPHQRMVDDKVCFEDLLEQVVLARGDLSRCKQLVVEHFYRTPTQEQFVQAHDVSVQAGFWTEVREMCLHFLMTGEDQLGLDRTFSDDFPICSELLKVMLWEENWLGAVDLLNLMWDARDRFRVYYSKLVANAIEPTHPREAIAIWDRLLQSVCYKKGADAGECTVEYLLAMKPIYKRLGERNTWLKIVENLRRDQRREDFQFRLDRVVPRIYPGNYLSPGYVPDEDDSEEIWEAYRNSKRR